MINPGEFTYADFIRSYSNAAQALFKQAAISQPIDAMGHEHCGGFADFYISMRNLAAELNCVYGAAIPHDEDPVITVNERAARVVEMNKAVFTFVNQAPETAYGVDYFDLPDIEDQIGAMISFLEAGETEAEQLTMQSLLCNTLKMHRLRLALHQECLEQEIVRQIEESSLVTKFAEQISSAEGNNEERIFISLHNACHEMLSHQQRPSIPVVRKNLFKYLKQYRCLDNKVTPDQLDPMLVKHIGLLMNENYGTFQEAHKNQQTFEQILDRHFSDMPSLDLVDVICTRNIHQLCHEAPEKIAYHSDTFRPFRYQQTDAKFNELATDWKKDFDFGWLTQYENAPLPNEKVLKDFKKLIKKWINAQAEICEEILKDIDIAECYADQKGQPMQSTDFDHKMLYRMHNLIKANNAVSQYFGIRMDGDGLTMAQLQQIKERQQPLSEQELQLFQKTAVSFLENYDQCPAQFDAEKEITLSSQLVKNIVKLPESEDRYNMLYYAQIALRTVGAVANQDVADSTNDCVDSLRGIHSSSTEVLQKDLQDHFGSTQAARLATDINNAVTRHHLLPLYSWGEETPDVKQKILVDIKDYAALSPTKKEDVDGLIGQHMFLSKKIHEQGIVDQTELPLEFLCDLDIYCESKNLLKDCQKQLQTLEQPLLEAQLPHQKYQRCSALHKTLEPKQRTNFRLIGAMHACRN